MRVALVAVPSRRASYTPTWAAWLEPRSSALTMSRRSSGPYPRRSAKVAIGPHGSGGGAPPSLPLPGVVRAAAGAPQAAALVPGPSGGRGELALVGDVGRVR